MTLPELNTRVIESDPYRSVVIYEGPRMKTKSANYKGRYNCTSCGCLLTEEKEYGV